MAKIKAPFTNEQVKKLIAWQEGNTEYLEKSPGVFINMPMHPFTCCSHEGCNRSEQVNEGALIPGTQGWICPCGKYTQDWCHDFMVGGNNNEHIELELLYKALELIPLASTKGFEWSGSFPPLMDHWMPYHDVFLNQICTMLQWWLRKHHNVLVWIEPHGKDRVLYAHIQFPNGRETFVDTSAETEYIYERQLIEALELAINSLSDAG